ncbi:MAG: DUF4351 domain-containing protein [Gemmataceae bacterium]|nr:DUF4351 domain-containing protein [Gemmataceae bacterium]
MCGVQEILRFNYFYVGLPALEAESYLAKASWIGVALAALMRVAAERRAWLRAEALRRIYQECTDSDYRRLLLAECVEAYLTLDPQQQIQYDQLLRTERYQAMLPTMTTTFEKGLHKGKRESIQLQLEKRFGPLSEAVRQRLEAWPAERLNELLLAVVDAPSLAALKLEG